MYNLFYNYSKNKSSIKVTVYWYLGLTTNMDYIYLLSGTLINLLTSISLTPR